MNDINIFDYRLCFIFFCELKEKRRVQVWCRLTPRMLKKKHKAKATTKKKKKKKKKKNRKRQQRF